MAVGIPTPHFNWGDELGLENSRGSKGIEKPRFDFKGTEIPRTDSKGVALPNSIEASYMHWNDYYRSESLQNVVIRCGPKAVHVESVLSEPVRVEGIAHCRSFMSSLEKIGGGNIVTLLDFLGRSVGNGGLRQPWMSRKIWQGSEPLRLTLNLKFLATGGNEEFLGADKAGFIEVYQPTCQLMSLIYPGGVSSGEVDEAGEKIYAHFVPPGPSAFHAFRGDDSQNGQVGRNGIVGHPVDVQVGNFILFQNCFVTSCSVEYSPLLDPSGYPMSATASLTVESYEYPFVDIDAANAIQSGSGSLRDTIAPPFTLFKLNQQTNDMLQVMVNTMLDMAEICEASFRFAKDTLIDVFNSRTRQQDDSPSGGGFQKPWSQMTQAERDEHLRKNVKPLYNPFKRPDPVHQGSSGETHSGGGGGY
jgi:hypothetical protein